MMGCVGACGMRCCDMSWCGGAAASDTLSLRGVFASSCAGHGRAHACVGDGVVRCEGSAAPASTTVCVAVGRAQCIWTALATLR